MRPRAILFDLDDTIIDHSGSMEDCWEAVYQRARILLPGIEREAMRKAHGEVAEQYWSSNHREGRLDLLTARRRVFRDALHRLGLETAHAEELGSLFHDLRESSYELLPGALETLERLREEGVMLALVTNGETLLQRSKVERFDLARHFDHIQIEEEFGVGKPEPGAYRHALATLDVKADETWMIGDNLEWEIAAPQKVGIYSVWVDRQRRGLPEGSDVQPDRIVHSIREILDVFEQEAAS